jgi:replicative DNA helicase
MMLSPIAIDAVCAIIGAEDFYQDAHQQIFAAIVALHEKNKPVDAVTVAEWLEKKKTLGDVGGPDYFHTILESVPHAGHAVYYAQLVRNAADRRVLIQSASEAIQEAYDGCRDTEQIAGDIQDGAFRVLERIAGSTKGDISIRGALQEAMASIGAVRSLGISSGYPSLDRLTFGFKPGNLVIMAGRPSSGKTAWTCGNVAIRIARRGDPVFIASAEQPTIELVERFIAIESKISWNKMRENDLSVDESQEVLDAAARVSDLPIYVDDRRGLTVRQTGAMLRALMRKVEIKIAIVDYLQLVEPDDRRLPREQQVSSITRQLRNLAGQLKIPIIVLAQLNRDIEKREKDKRPRLADLRESGAIEQDADMVLFMDRRLEIKEGEPSPWEPTLILAKQRNGPLGDVKLKFSPSIVSFEDAGGTGLPDEPDPWDQQEQGELFA